MSTRQCSSTRNFLIKYPYHKNYLLNVDSAFDSVKSQEQNRNLLNRIVNAMTRDPTVASAIFAVVAGFEFIQEDAQFGEKSELYNTMKIIAKHGKNAEINNDPIRAIRDVLNDNVLPVIHTELQEVERIARLTQPECADEPNTKWRGRKCHVKDDSVTCGLSANLTCATGMIHGRQYCEESAGGKCKLTAAGRTSRARKEARARLVR